MGFGQVTPVKGLEGFNRASPVTGPTLRRYPLACQTIVQLRDGKPLISYDYYLDVNRPVAEAAADLEELIQFNPQRPYFLLIHIRESNTIEKVKQIIDSLTEPVEVVPVDVFLKLAASEKTYRTRYQQPGDPIDHNP